LLQERRTRLRCGVFVLCAVFAASCTPGSSATNVGLNELRIGNPEGIVEGTELGIRQLASMLSVESLTQLGADGRPLPKLAESWWWGKDGRELNVNLRPGIKFHDGTPLTAALAATILGEAVARPSNRATYSSLPDVTNVRPQGERQLVFDLLQPSAFLPEDLELPLTHGSPTVGTGPFRVVTSDQTGVVLERFSGYYLGIPKIARVIVKPFDTLRTAWTSLLRGEVDMVTDVPPDAVEFISNDEVRVVSFGRRYQYLVAFNSRKPPFNSPIVRRALNTAIDRDALIQRALQGHGLASTGPLWPKHWAYNTSIASYRFDPGLAVSLLNSAGIKADKRSGGPQARFRFTCLIPEDFSVIERVALEVQKQLYNVGVDMQFEVIPIREFGVRVQEGNFDAILIDMISGPTVGRSYLFWRSARHVRGLNTFGYENAEAERLFDVLRTSTNDIAVQSAFTRFQEVLLDDPPALFLAWNERSRAVRRDFQIEQDPGRDPADPVYTIWRWTAGPPRLALAQ
jgi:peptide/nickel transport system substrate-binding protein